MPGRITPDPLLAALDGRLSPGARVVDDPGEAALYAGDASILRGRAGPVVFAACTADVVEVVRACVRWGRSWVPRGAGTGLAGGAVPLDGALVLSTAKMRRVLSVDTEAAVAWVDPGVANLALTEHLCESASGLHYAPDPSSQAACSIGGNVATNAGGLHCFAHGVTQHHVLAVELVTPEGDVVVCGAVAPDPVGYDLRGVVVGSEGTLGVVTKVCVRLMADPGARATLLAAFGDVAAAASAVGRIVAEGVSPVALEMMDRRIVRAVEAFVEAGLPLDAAAVLLAEVEGPPLAAEERAAAAARLCAEAGATEVRRARDAAEAGLWWRARKSAFGAVARVAPNYHLHDCVVPRTRLVDALAGVYEIADRHRLAVMNVFHAGDGNLHPLLGFDLAAPGELGRVQAAGREIVELCVSLGGVLSGEHGIGVEKRDFMALMFSRSDLDAQARLRDSLDPTGLCNPAKVLPAGSRCPEIGVFGSGSPAPREGTWA